MSHRLINWMLFILLCFIWGSSFMLMKLGIHELSPYQVASIRLFSAGLVLVPFAVKALRAIPKRQLFFSILSGLLGSFFPAYLFCLAQTRIDSSLAGILNALTPLFTIILGVVFFRLKAAPNKWIGIITGFIGLSLLPFAANKGVSLNDFSYSLLVLLATLLYGLNVNVVGTYLRAVNSINIAALAFVFLMIPSGIILYFTGYFEQPLANPNYIRASVASAVLGIMGTAVASILFYMLLKRAGALFASMVTYGIPFVAIFWGLLDNETITIWQVGCLGIILTGVYLANRN
ncbi:MAG TPA: DMT family transporter [Chitinophagaceae bacterium]